MAEKASTFSFHLSSLLTFSSQKEANIISMKK